MRSQGQTNFKMQVSQESSKKDLLVVLAPVPLHLLRWGRHGAKNLEMLADRQTEDMAPRWQPEAEQVRVVRKLGVCDLSLLAYFSSQHRFVDTKGIPGSFGAAAPFAVFCRGTPARDFRTPTAGTSACQAESRRDARADAEFQQKNQETADKPRGREGRHTGPFFLPLIMTISPPSTATPTPAANTMLLSIAAPF